MRTRGRWLASLVVATAVASPGAARAQTFPADSAYVALPCRGGPMSDPYQDESGALRERDIVGDAAAPAGLRAADDDFFYLRLRLDDDPAPGGALRQFSWGIELDTDGDVTTYEVLIIVRKGAREEVALHRNSTTTLPNDPNDPADEPPVATYLFATNGSSVTAAGSTYGGDADFFLELAVPWSDLQAVGVQPGQPVVAWAASSATATSLNGDFACHDGASGDPTLDATAADPTVLDPEQDSDGDGYSDQLEIAEGFDPLDPASHPGGPGDTRQTLYEGGGGCRASGGPASGAAAVLTLAATLALLLGRRRRR